jgi:AcrR family transcriptional regulator
MQRLPRGRHGLSREFVARSQRERLITGLTEVLYEVGYPGTTVSLIGRRAAVSKADFYKHFESKDDCFQVAYEAAIGRLRSEVAAACFRHAGSSPQVESQWPQRVRDGLASLLGTLAAEPQLASICLVEGLRAGPAIYDRYQAAVEDFAARLREGAPPAPGGGQVPPGTEQAIVGGISTMLGRRVLAGRAEQIGELLPEALELALTPYLGSRGARRIISAG